MIFTTLVSLLVLAAATTATPIQPHQLDVISPAITSPTAAVNWPPGSTHNVTWNASSVPPSMRNNTGLILLGHITNDGGNGQAYSENLNISHPLATNFPIGAGWVAVKIPKDTPPRENYVIVLFGDSGNASPQFKIGKN